MVNAASDAAFQDLLERVLERRLTDHLTVAGLMVVAPDVESWLRQSLFEARQTSQPRVLPDGTVEVDVRVPTDVLADLVRQLAGRYLPGSDTSSVLAGPLAQEVTGLGRIRRFPEGVAPTGWRHCTPRQMELAATAARFDLCERLINRVGPWLLSPLQTVGKLLADNPDLRNAARKTFHRLQLPPPVFEPTGVCRLRVEFSRATIIAWLKASSQQCEPPVVEDLSRAVDPEGEDPLVLEGQGVAPPAREPAPGPREVDVQPAWVARTIKMTATRSDAGVGSDPQERHRLAVAAARLEAKRRLWLEIEQLPCPGGTTLADLLDAQPAGSDAMRTIDRAIRWEEATPGTEADRATVSAELPLAAVWQIIRDMLRARWMTHPSSDAASR